jgi:hypothetical protein
MAEPALPASIPLVNAQQLEARLRARGALQDAALVHAQIGATKTGEEVRLPQGWQLKNTTSADWAALLRDVYQPPSAGKPGPALNAPPVASQTAREALYDLGAASGQRFKVFTPRVNDAVVGAALQAEKTLSKEPPLPDGSRLHARVILTEPAQGDDVAALKRLMAAGVEVFEGDPDRHKALSHEKMDTLAVGDGVLLSWKPSTQLNKEDVVIVSDRSTADKALAALSSPADRRITQEEVEKMAARAGAKPRPQVDWKNQF